ncbi:acyltransferase [Kwoniella mangroviensis CBS 8886]|nr:acyltransferase [Kwoniella mangroviensis CBS 8886]
MAMDVFVSQFQGWSRLMEVIVITVLFGPTSLVLTTDTPPSITNLVERDAHGNLIKINLPARLVIMANHQAYLDWMYLWILSCYAGHSRGITILLKASLKNIPVIGWGMRFFKFIFMNRSWATDRDNLTLALTQLGHQAQSGEEDHSETSGLLAPKKRSPLWLLIFPEGTIVSDEERVKSVKYAEREGIPDFITMLHPRSTGLLFCLRTLLPQVPNLQLLDVTIGYPGVPYGKYPQDCRSLSVGDDQPPSDTGIASPEESRAFELWLRGIWTAKEKRMEGFYENQRFESGEGGAREVIHVKQT